MLKPLSTCAVAPEEHGDARGVTATGLPRLHGRHDGVPLPGTMMILLQPRGGLTLHGIEFLPTPQHNMLQP